MNWLNLLPYVIISVGGFTVATYEAMAVRMGLPVGLYFQKNGIATIVGGFVTFGVAIASAFINHGGLYS